jgi:hypothetical protein
MGLWRWARADRARMWRLGLIVITVIGAVTCAILAAAA